MFEFDQRLARLGVRGELPHERVGCLDDGTSSLGVSLGEGRGSLKEDDVHGFDL